LKINNLLKIDKYVYIAVKHNKFYQSLQNMLHVYQFLILHTTTGRITNNLTF